MKTPQGRSSSHNVLPSMVGGYGFQWETSCRFLGLPLICVRFGRDASGRLRVARGWLSIGKFAVGLIAIGQFSLGLLSVGLFGAGLIAVGQLALGVVLGFGQVATGVLAIGQVVVGMYGLGQIGWATYIWSQTWTDMEAVSIFSTARMMILNEGGIGLEEVIRGGIDWGLDGFRALFK